MSASMQRVPKLSSAEQVGFTLIEVILALSIFSAILAMGYQMLISVAEAQKRVAQNGEQQAAMRAAHQFLSNAVSSGAPVTGDAQSAHFNLRRAKSNWLAGSTALKVSIREGREGRELIVSDDVQAASSVLVKGLQGARLEYYEQGGNYSRWQHEYSPDYLQLTWLEGERQLSWRFAYQ